MEEKEDRFFQRAQAKIRTCENRTDKQRKSIEDRCHSTNRLQVHSVMAHLMFNNELAM